MATEPTIIGESAIPTEPVPGGGATGDTVEATTPALPAEHGGRDGPEPTRFGDWEKNGRCIDF